MTTVTSAKTILEADATLLALATGGIYDYDETGRMGINRTNTATSAAFVNGIIQPCILLKLRTSVPWGEINDDATQTVSMREVFEVQFYADNAYTVIESMRARVFALLHAKQLSGTFICRFAGNFYSPRDIEMDSFVLRSDYAVVLKRN